MSQADPSPSALTDLSELETSIDPATVARWSDGSYIFEGSDGQADFFVDFEFGYDRPNGFLPGDKANEPETLHIWDVEVSEGHGLGSAVIASLIEHAKEKGFHAGRMDIINPRMIGVVNKLQRLGIIQASYFRLERGEHIRPQPATVDVMHAPGVLSAEEASAVFTPIDAELSIRRKAGEDITDDSATVDCTIFF